MVTEKKTQTKTIQSTATAPTVTINHIANQNEKLTGITVLGGMANSHNS